jgi:hypothetical protein
MSDHSVLERLLRTDPRDVGCEQALDVLHLYVELVLHHAGGNEAALHYPGVTAHLLACGPCADDLQGLLALTGAGAGS